MKDHVRSDAVECFGKLLPRADIQLVIGDVRMAPAVGSDINDGDQGRVSVVLELANNVRAQISTAPYHKDGTEIAGHL